jgi:hypothetical protein
MWSPHGLGVRRENGSAEGAGRKGGPRPCGVEGKVQLKCVGGRKVLVAVGHAPFQKGAPLSERVRPYCLFDWQGAQAPSGGLVTSSSSFMQLRVDEN